MGVELGIWQGEYQNVTLPWLRWWDLQDNLLLTGEECAQQLEAILALIENVLVNYLKIIIRNYITLRSIS